MTPIDFDVVVIGAGPAGASVAILLARAGWSVALVEKQAFPRRKVCGECIAASNLGLLDALGVGSEFSAVAGPELRRLEWLHGSRSAPAALPAAGHPVHRYGRALGRETLDTLLLAQARRVGAQVFQPASVLAVDGGPGAFRCTLRAAGPGTAPRLRSRVVIAANGSWEALPNVGAPRRAVRRASDLFAFKANFQAASIAQGTLAVLGFHGGYGGMVQADGGMMTLACCIRRDRLDALRRAAPGARAGDAVQAMLADEVDGVRSALRDARRDGPWLAAGPIAPGIRLRGDDAILRVGNAAGEAHPIIGEGMSMALQSAWLLSAHLQAGGPPALVAAHYAGQWRGEFAPRLALAAGFAQLAMSRPGAAALTLLARRWPALLTRAAVWGGKTRCAVDAASLTARPIPESLSTPLETP